MFSILADTRRATFPIPIYGFMGSKKHHDIEWLKEQYHDKGRTQADIAEECGITQSTLSGHMKRHGIKSRSRSEASSRAQRPDGPYADEEWLRREYHDKGRTMYEIADEFDMTATGIAHWMDKHGIERRDNREAQRPEGKHTDGDWLHEQYHEQGKSIQELADEAGTNVATIHRWMVNHGIPRRGSHDHWRKYPAVLDTVYGNFGEIPGGWCQWTSYVTRDGERIISTCYVHQLLAIAEGEDPQKVFSGGDYHVHHKNGLRWDNRPDNLELVTPAEHRNIHTS